MRKTLGVVAVAGGIGFAYLVATHEKETPPAPPVVTEKAPDPTPEKMLSYNFLTVTRDYTLTDKSGRDVIRVESGSCVKPYTSFNPAAIEGRSIMVMASESNGYNRSGYIDVNYVRGADSSVTDANCMATFTGRPRPAIVPAPAEAVKTLRYGIGITDKGDYLTVTGWIQGSPVYQAGIRTGDLIIQINGESTREMTVEQGLQKIQAGDSMKLLVRNYMTGENKEIVLNKALVPEGSNLVTEGRPPAGRVTAGDSAAIRKHGVVMAESYAFVTADELNLREAPRTSSKAVGQLLKDFCLFTIGTEGNVNGMLNVLAFDPAARKFHEGYVSVDYLRGSASMGMPMSACTAIIK